MGCLPVAPAPSGATGATAAPIRALPPLNTQAALTEARSPAFRGVVRGTCDGPVRVEAGSPNQSRPLAGKEVTTGPFDLRVPAGVALTLRWGCDADGDGEVPAAHVAEAVVGILTWDVPLDLQLPDPERAARFALVTPNDRVASAPPLLPGGPVGTGGAHAPPQGLAPADGAIGPPLPNGPPADAGPPPPAGAAIPSPEGAAAPGAAAGPPPQGPPP